MTTMLTLQLSRMAGQFILFVLAITTMSDGEAVSTSSLLSQSSIACERSPVKPNEPDLQLSCPSSTILKILHANYGRTRPDNEVCSYGQAHNNLIDCRRDVTAKVKQFCDKNSSCSAPPTNDAYEDPCVGTYKYLEVEYACLPSFDPTTHSCCCGNIFTGPDRQAKCCGGQTYDDQVDSCCNGVLTTGLSEAGTNCCGDNAYIPLTHTCCQGHIVPAQPGQDRCCGHSPYNPKTQICCQGEVYEGGFNWRCCGSGAYNPRVSICCYENVQPLKGLYTQCCGDKSYSPGEKICCSDVLQINPVASLDILGHKLQLSKIACERSQVIPNAPNLGLACAAMNTLKILHANYGRTQADDQVCPYGQDHNDITYCIRDVTEELKEYCDGKSSCSVPPTNEKFGDPCVDTYKYLEVDYYCLPDMVSHPAFPDILYQSGNQIVCCGTVVDVEMKADTGCCSNVAYNFYTQLCCGEIVMDLDPSNHRCCGTQPYNIWSKTCCNGVVKDSAGQCCGSQVFDPKCEVCCQGEIPHGSLCSSCCYDPDTNKAKGYCPQYQLCCDGEVHEAGPYLRCCGKRWFNNKFSTCCNGRIIPRRVSQNEGICVDEPIPLPGQTCVCPAPPTVHVGIACEDKSLDITCPVGTTINIISAIFGRTQPYSILCYHHTAPNEDTSCIGEAGPTIIESCLGKSSCTVAVGREIAEGGDPCPGTFKYLDVKYSCLSNSI